MLFYSWLFQYIRYSNFVYICLFMYRIYIILQSCETYLQKKNQLLWLACCIDISRIACGYRILSTYGWLAAMNRALWLARCVTSSLTSRIASGSIDRVNGSRRGRSDSKSRSVFFAISLSFARELSPVVSSEMSRVYHYIKCCS